MKKNKGLVQCMLMLDYLIEEHHHCINTIQARSILDILQPATIVFKLRKEYGCDIETIPISVGIHDNVALYKLRSINRSTRETLERLKYISNWK